MRRRLGILVIVVGIVVASIGGALVGTASARTVLFRDDFSGTQLDTTKWNPSWFGSGSNPSNPVNGAEDDCYDPAQVTVSGGYLHLAAVKRTCLGHAYASGLVNTNGKFSYSTGTFRARIWLPGTTSTIDWPGMWTDGQHWPGDGEIDVIEGLGGHDCWHVHSSAPTVGSCTTTTGGWHRFRLVRTKTTATFFYDNVKVGSTPINFSALHYLVFNLAVSKSISPPEQAAEMLVDHVEVDA